MMKIPISISIKAGGRRIPSFSSGGNVKDMMERKGMFGGSPAQLMENYR